ncbi:MAG: ATP-binding cassette domain-containing protein, partial [Thermoleophilaceae bacterium]|nr:ATP-binding cassette domain-containing protein [Thermoleophilaceae bacterium]
GGPGGAPPRGWGGGGGGRPPPPGAIEIGGEVHTRLTPSLAQESGLAIVHQHPALLPDMTVAENMSLAAPKDRRGSGSAAWMREQLERVGCSVELSTRMEELSVAQRQLVEVAKALALEPKVLILDEPTAPLGAEMVAGLFEQIRAATARGAAVIYISHRLPEVREIADRVTVLRDGAVRGSAPIDEISDEEMVRLIVGRSVSTTFPPKRSGDELPDGASGGLVVRGLSNQAFENVDLEVRPGEIVGLAGIAGNGQSELLRALAGLARASGEVRLGGRELKLGSPARARAAGVAYMSADRHEEGLLMRLSVRENATLSSLERFARSGVVQRRAEVAAVEEQRKALNIRTVSIEKDVGALSGGNQQKVVLARALLSQPKLVLADEPTQGVDAGARVEIYRILREIADSGIPVLIVSSDGLEIEGLCDRVLVFSRGHVVGELKGDDVSEEQIARTILTATSHRGGRGEPSRAQGRSDIAARVRQFAKGDYAPSAILALAVVLLAAYTYGQNQRFLAAFNLSSLLLLLAALAFIAFGQLIVIMTAGIDISVGPLAGLVAVIGSFFVVDGKSTATVVLGFAIMLGAALAVGVLNGSLVRFGRFTPVAATLATYIALQGISLLLRPFQGGYISAGVSSAIERKVGVVPVAFIVAVCLAILLEYCLRYTRWGLALRAAGSDEDSAHRLGVGVDRAIVLAYVASSALTFLGGVMLMAQIGVGDPTQGVSYTLASITAVVLGGASLFGGRGSFIGALLGAALIQEIINATTFLSLSQAWQFWFQGLFVLVAAAVYTTARRRGVAA